MLGMVTTEAFVLETYLAAYAPKSLTASAWLNTRGFVRVTGLARVTLAVALQAVATNISELETWAAKYGDERSPGRRGEGARGVAPRTRQGQGR